MPCVPVFIFCRRKTDFMKQAIKYLANILNFQWIFLIFLNFYIMYACRAYATFYKTNYIYLALCKLDVT